MKRKMKIEKNPKAEAPTDYGEILGIDDLDTTEEEDETLAKPNPAIIKKVRETQKKQRDFIKENGIKIETKDANSALEYFKSVFLQKKPEPKRKKCNMCERTYDPSTFYRSRHPFVSEGSLEVCSHCLKAIIDIDDIVHMKAFCLLGMYPFVEELWQKARLPGNRESGLGYYCNHIWHHYGKAPYVTFEDLAYDEAKKYGDPYYRTFVSMDKKEMEYLLAKWGSNYEILDCIKLEDYYLSMIEDYEIKTRAHQDYLKNIAKTSLAMDYMMANGDLDGYKKLAATYDALMKSANFAEAKVDKKKEEANNTFGQLYELAEKHGFIPDYYSLEESQEQMDIVDKTIRNLKTWTKKLITEEPNLQELLEHAANRLIAHEDAKLENADKEDAYDVEGFEDDEES